jgi:hypothetical protein
MVINLEIFVLIGTDEHACVSCARVAAPNLAGLPRHAMMAMQRAWDNDPDLKKLNILCARSPIAW